LQGLYAMTKLFKCLLILSALTWSIGVPVPGDAVPSSVAAAYADDGPAAPDALGDEGEGHAEGEPGEHHLADVVDTSAPNIAVFIWQLILFIVFFAVLAKFVWPPILKGLKGREEKMRSDLVGAETARKDADAALAEYKAKIAEAQQAAQKVIDEARKSAEQVASKVKADAETEISKMKERAKAEIESAKDAALGEVYAQTAELSTQIASRILKREINAADQQQLVNDSLAELTQSGV